MAFHQSVSGAMGTALQHLADSSFVHLANLILLRRDAYLDHIKPGVKQDTWLHLQNAPLFGFGLFPDNVIFQAEQDIVKHDSASVALGRGLLGAQEIGTGHMSVGNLPVIPLLDNFLLNSLGDNLDKATDQGVVVGVGVQLLVSPSRTSTPNINDNYCTSPTIKTQNVSQTSFLS